MVHIPWIFRMAIKQNFHFSWIYIWVFVWWKTEVFAQVGSTLIFFLKICTAFLCTLWGPHRKWVPLGPKYQNFGVKLHIFVRSDPLERRRSIFSKQKRCLIWGYQKFCSLPKKLWVLAKKWPTFIFFVILGQILAFLAHLVICPTQKQCKALPR